MADFIETSFGYIQGENVGVFCTNQRKRKNKILKWKEAFPSEININTVNTDGSMVVEIPVKWFKLSPPRKISDEQKRVLSERMKRLREERNNAK